ncbi:MAG: HEAT repeat domain-containing protein [Pseudomonadota bacterium]
MIYVHTLAAYMMIIFLSFAALLFGSCSSHKSAEEDAKDSNVIATPISHPKNLSVEMQKLQEGLQLKLTESESKQLDQMELAEDEIPQPSEDEIMLDQALNHTLIELISLNPNKDVAKIKQLLADIKSLSKIENFKTRVPSVIETMLDEDRPINEKILLTHALGAVNDANASDKLFQMVSSEDDRNIRNAAAEALSKSKQQRNYIQLASTKLYDATSEDSEKSVEEQLSLIGFLGNSKNDESLNTLREIVSSSENSKVRVASIDAIAQIGSDEAVDFLFEMLREPALRQNAAKHLGKFEKEDVTQRLGELIINDEEEQVKQIAIEALGYDSSQNARKILISLLSNKEATQQFHQWAASSLQNTITDQEIPSLVALIAKSNDPKLQHLPNLLIPLVAKRGAVAIEHIEPNLNSAEEIPKLQLIRTLGRIQDEKSFNVLSNYFFTHPDEKEGVKAEIIQAMSNQKTPKAVSIFEKVVWEASEPGLRNLALNSIGNVLGKDSAPVATRIISMTNERELIQTAIEMLRKYGSSDEKVDLIMLKTSGRYSELEGNINSAIAAIEARSN